jgi:predicted nucleotidyltransferase
VHVPPELQSGPLLEVLNRHGVDFVLIGGLASVHWGSPFITRDLDITPRRSQENLDRLSSALAELEATIRIDAEPEGIPFSHTGTSLGENLIWNLRTTYGDLDISFVPSGTAGFEDLARDAADERIQGIEVRVASLADVIRSKQAANRPKDQRVLPTLREILASRNPRNHPKS